MTSKLDVEVFVHPSSYNPPLIITVVITIFFDLLRRAGKVRLFVPIGVARGDGGTSERERKTDVQNQDNKKCLFAYSHTRTHTL